LGGINRHEDDDGEFEPSHASACHAALCIDRHDSNHRQGRFLLEQIIGSTPRRSRI